MLSRRHCPSPRRIAEPRLFSCAQNDMPNGIVMQKQEGGLPGFRKWDTFYFRCGQRAALYVKAVAPHRRSHHARSVNPRGVPPITSTRISCCAPAGCLVGGFAFAPAASREPAQVHERQDGRGRAARVYRRLQRRHGGRATPYAAHSARVLRATALRTLASVYRSACGDGQSAEHRSGGPLRTADALVAQARSPSAQSPALRRFPTSAQAAAGTSRWCGRSRHPRRDARSAHTLWARAQKSKTVMSLDCKTMEDAEAWVKAIKQVWAAERSPAGGAAPHAACLLVDVATEPARIAPLAAAALSVAQR
jgi:hypothetical protein